MPDWTKVGRIEFLFFFIFHCSSLTCSRAFLQLVLSPVFFAPYTLAEVRTTHAASTVSSELAAVNERARAAAADAAALHEQLDAAHRLRARDALEWQRVCAAYLGGALTRDELAAHVHERQAATANERQVARAQLERYERATAAAQADIEALTAAHGGGGAAAASPAPPGGAF